MRKSFHRVGVLECVFHLSGINSFRCVRPEPEEKGFARVELAAAVAALALLAALVMPALANTRPRSQRVACVNKLSQIGQAFDMWATDHAGHYPMTVPYWEGGLYVSSPAPAGTTPPPWATIGLNANLWFHFLSLSNELASPKVFVCPSDGEKRPALDYANSPSGGFVHPNYMNNAVSFMLGHPSPEEGRSVLSGDRNLSPDLLIQQCPYFYTAWAFSIPSVTWKTNIHVNTGNLLFNDGSVEQTDPAALRSALTGANTNASTVHFLLPR